MRSRPVEHGEGRGIEHHGFLARLAFRQEQQAALEVDMLPFQVQDFAQPAAGEQQQPDRRRRMRTDDGTALALGDVFRGWLGLVHVPGDPVCFRLADRRAEPHKLVRRQEPLASVFGVFFDPRAGFTPLRDQPALAGEAVHAADHRHDPVGLIGRPLPFQVQLGDV